MKNEDFDFSVESRIMPHDPVELRGKTRGGGKMIVLDRSTPKSSTRSSRAFAITSGRAIC